MPLKLHRFGIVLFALALGFAAMLMTSRAEAQTTNCMAMGGEMIHCNTMGSGGMSSTDCMAMGPNMRTCNTIGGGSTGGGRLASPVEVYRMIFGDKTRKNIGRMLANGDCNGAAQYAYSHGRLELGTKIAQSCRANDTPSYAASSRSPAYRPSPAPTAQTPMSLYETVDFLARNIPIPFTMDDGVGAITKVEAFNTQLRMTMQVNNPNLTLADVTTPADLHVLCEEPNFSRVLRLGGSIRLTFVRKGGALLGVATETEQLCRF